MNEKEPFSRNVRVRNFTEAAARLLRAVESVNYIFCEATSRRNAISIRRFRQPQRSATLKQWLIFGRSGTPWNAETSKRISLAPFQTRSANCVKYKRDSNSGSNFPRGISTVTVNWRWNFTRLANSNTFRSQNVKIIFLLKWSLGLPECGN